MLKVQFSHESVGCKHGLIIDITSISTECPHIPHSAFPNFMHVIPNESARAGSVIVGKDKSSTVEDVTCGMWAVLGGSTNVRCNESDEGIYLEHETTPGILDYTFWYDNCHGIER